jgi:transaldolase
MGKALDDLAAAQVSVWLDDLSRPRIQTGSLARMVEGGEIIGITTNPTISRRLSMRDRATRTNCVI